MNNECNHDPSQYNILNVKDVWYSCTWSLTIYLTLYKLQAYTFPMSMPSYKPAGLRQPHVLLSSDGKLLPLGNYWHWSALINIYHKAWWSWRTGLLRNSICLLNAILGKHVLFFIWVWNGGWSQSNYHFYYRIFDSSYFSFYVEHQSVIWQRQVLSISHLACQ